VFVSALLGLVSTPALGVDKPTFVARWVMALLPAGCPFNRALFVWLSRWSETE